MCFNTRFREWNIQYTLQSYESLSFENRRHNISTFHSIFYTRGFSFDIHIRCCSDKLTYQGKQNHNVTCPDTWHQTSCLSIFPVDRHLSMEPELRLDPAIRLWVFLPIVLITFLVGIVRHYVSVLLSSQKKVDLTQVKDSQILLRARNLRENARFIPRQVSR